MRRGLQFVFLFSGIFALAACPGPAVAPPTDSQAPNNPPGKATGDGTPERIAPARKAPWIGLYWGPAPRGSVARVQVLGVARKSPADEAGLAVGDLLLKVDGRPLSGPEYLQGVLDTKPPGQAMSFEVAGRDGRGYETTLTVAGFDAAEVIGNALDAGAAWLGGQQGIDGGWRPAKGETSEAWLSALTLRALAALPTESRSPNATAIEKAAAYIIARQTDKGSIVDHEERVHYRSYATALSLQAFSLLGGEARKAPADRMRDFLVEAQLDDGEGITDYDWRYGAWNYYDSAAQVRADISCSSYVIEALARAGLPPEHEVWKRARLFLERSQNMPDARAARGKQVLLDGGFGFGPRDSKAGRQDFADGQIIFRSYGSSTSDGLRSILRTGMALDETRVLAAADWLTRLYTLDRNPGFPDEIRVAWSQGIYFYYFASLSDALASFRDRPGVLRDEIRDWPWALARLLAVSQESSGAWRNPEPLNMEDDPVIATSFALVALSNCRLALER